MTNPSTISVTKTAASDTAWPVNLHENFVQSLLMAEQSGQLSMSSPHIITYNNNDNYATAILCIKKGYRITVIVPECRGSDECASLECLGAEVIQAGSFEEAQKITQQLQSDQNAFYIDAITETTVDIRKTVKRQIRIGHRTKPQLFTCNLSSIIESRFAEVLYAFFVMILVPLVVYSFLPVHVVAMIYWTISSAFIATAIWQTVELTATLIARRRRMPEHEEKTSSPNGFPRILCIVPAYLDNEKAILKETLEAYCRVKGEITVLLVYNVKKKSRTWDFEEYLRLTWHGFVTNGVQFFILENESGNSKATNVNYALDWAQDQIYDYIGIFDADHHPEPNDMILAVQCFQEYNCDIVQGQCAIRNFSESFLTRLIAMDFTDMYNIGHEGRTFVFTLGIFGGSNGLWKSDLLREIKMDASMLTEDIDSTFRSLINGKEVRYCHKMISYELAPVTWRTLLKQRQRWSQGWLEVSIKYFIATQTSSMSIRKKFGCFMLLFWRELFVLLVFHPICMIIAFYFVQSNYGVPPSAAQWTMMGSALFSGLVRTLAIYPVANTKLKQQSIGWFLAYILLQPLLASVLNFVQISTHWRHFTRQNNWIPTSRDTSTAAPPETPVKKLGLAFSKSWSSTISLSSGSSSGNASP